MSAIFSNHLVTAAHAANLGFQDGAAGIGKCLARRDMGLFADNAFAVDFLDTVLAVGNHPVAGEQAGTDGAFVANGDVIGKHPALAVRIALIGKEFGFHRDLNIVARAHDCSVDVILAEG